MVRIIGNFLKRIFSDTGDYTQIFDNEPDERPSQRPKILEIPSESGSYLENLHKFLLDQEEGSLFSFNDERLQH